MANCIVQTGNSAGVNVRASKSTGSTKLGVIDNGVTVNVVRCDGTWATLMYNGTPAFVQHQYLSGEPTVNGDGLSNGDSAVCNANSVNIRNAANGSTTGNQLNKGANVSISGKSLANGYYWYQIGVSRWVRGDFLAPGSGSGGSSGGNSEGGSGTTVAPSLNTIRNGDAYLKVGDYGTSVITLRNLLRSHGYVCDPTGFYDNSLKLVVKNYQSSNGVSADGHAGQITFALLEDNVSDTGWFSGKGTCILTAGKLARIGFTGKLILRPNNIARLNAAINDSRFDFTEKIHIRHFLAQGCKETDLGKTFTEYTYHPGWSKSQYNGSPSYAPYCGGGFMQLTHNYNYQSFKNFIGDSQIFSPESYATKYVADNYPFISAAWFWCKNAGLNQIIDGYSNQSADATVKKVTATVKGSSAGYSIRLGYYNKAKSVLK